MERLLRILGRVPKFRDDPVARLTRSDDVLRDCGKFTSVNITMLSAGKQVNVIPDEAVARRGDAWTGPVDDLARARGNLALGCRFGYSGRQGSWDGGDQVLAR